MAAIGLAITATCHTFILGSSGNATTDDLALSTEVNIHHDVGVRSEDLTVVILSAGPPPAEDVLLVSGDGMDTVSVTTLETENDECNDVQTLFTGQGNDRWCLRLSGLGAGESVSGTLLGSGSSVNMNLNIRHWWLLPTVVAVVCFAIAASVVWISSRWLPDRITKLLLDRQVKSDHEVDGLADWAKAARKGRQSEEGVLARVRWARRYGRDHVVSMRHSLHEAVESSSLPQCPLLSQATAEAQRTDVPVGDLLSASGARATSAAERLLGQVERASNAKREFDTVATSLVSKIPQNDPNRRAAEQIVNRADGLAKDYLSALTLDDYVRSLQEDLKQLEAYVPKAQRATAVYPAMLDGSVGTFSLRVLQDRQEPESAVAGTIVTSAAMAIIVGLLMAVAIVTVLASQYVPNAAFGTGWDYIVLAATMLGSSSAAGVVTILLLLRGPQNWVG